MGYACDRKRECLRFTDQTTCEVTPWTERLCHMGGESEHFIATLVQAEEPTV
jgi:hypothetical protein